MQYYTDQNPGILALHSSYRGLEGSSEAVPGIPAGCYRIVSYRTSLHPLRLPTVTTHAVPVTIPVPNPHGVPVSLSLSLSLSLPPLAHLLLPVFPLFLFLFFFFFFFLFFFPFFSLLLTTGFSRNSASTSIAFSLSFGRHSRFLVSCLTAGAKRCVGFGPPSPFCASSLFCYIFYSPLFFAWIRLNLPRRGAPECLLRG